jgi:hypothetical protein
MPALSLISAQNARAPGVAEKAGADPTIPLPGAGLIPMFEERET